MGSSRGRTPSFEVLKIIVWLSEERVLIFHALEVEQSKCAQKPEDLDKVVSYETPIKNCWEGNNSEGLKMMFTDEIDPM